VGTDLGPGQEIPCRKRQLVEVRDEGTRRIDNRLPGLVAPDDTLNVLDARTVPDPLKQLRKRELALAVHSVVDVSKALQRLDGLGGDMGSTKDDGYPRVASLTASARRAAL